MTRMYVGNIPFSATEHDLRSTFSVCGEVTRVDVVLDRDTGRPRGFAFVEVENADAALALDGSDFGGRRLVVNHAKERAQKAPRVYREYP
jgi:RNA recognition motif-containing protein